jgi:gluconate 2-dehydrogenase gamma chain
MADEFDDISRREAIKRLGYGTGAIVVLPVLSRHGLLNVEADTHTHVSYEPFAPQSQTTPQPFLSQSEMRTVAELAERIIPTDDSSPGAKEARVPDFIALIVSASPEPVRITWREGLAAVNSRSKRMFSRDFADATEAEQIELLAIISRNERNPQTVEERFFRTVKIATVDGYYTSEIGIRRELGYKGNVVLREFTGCTHPEHQN